MIDVNYITKCSKHGQLTIDDVNKGRKRNKQLQYRCKYCARAYQKQTYERYHRQLKIYHARRNMLKQIV